MRGSRLRAYVTRGLGPIAIVYMLVAGWLLVRYGGGLDMRAYYFGAQAAIRGLPFYDRAVVSQLAATLGDLDRVARFLYPPPSMLLFLPLAFVSLEAARWVLIVGQVIALALALRLVLDALDLDLPPGLAIAVPLLLPAPLYYLLALGQISALVFLLLVAAWYAERRGRQGWAGVWLGLAVLLRFVPLLLLPFFVARRDYRLVASALVTIGVGMALGEAAFRGSSEAFVGVILDVHYAAPEHWHNISLAGVSRRLFMSNLYAEPVVLVPYLDQLLALVGLVGVLAIAALGAASRLRGERTTDLAFALALIVFQLVSPVTWTHSLLVLILPLLVFVRLLRTRTDWLLLGVTWLLLSGPWGYFGFADGGFGRLSALLGLADPSAQPSLPPFWWTLLLASPLYGQLVVLWLGWRLLRRERTAPLPDLAQPRQSARGVVAQQPSG